MVFRLTALGLLGFVDNIGFFHRLVSCTRVSALASFFMSSTKNTAKPAPRNRMNSALTNLNDLIQTAPPLEAVAPEVKSDRKARPAKLAKPPAQRATKSETTITARIDLGFGNMLFIRGRGAGLSWEKGAPMTCHDASTWLWSHDPGEQIEFKLLLNDQVWAEGENSIASPGKKIEVTPRFP